MEEKVLTTETVKKEVQQMDAEYEAMEMQEKNIRNMEEEQEKLLQADFLELEKMREECSPEDKRQIALLDERQEILETIRKERAGFLEKLHTEIVTKKRENSRKSEDLYSEMRRQMLQSKE